MRVDTHDLLYQSEAQTFSVYRATDGPYIIAHLKGIVDKVEYRKGFEQVGKFMLEEPCYNLLIHTKDLTHTDPEARAWLIKRKIPDTVRALGHMNTAVVIPASTFQALATKLVMTGVRLLRKSLQIYTYQTLEGAAEWVSALGEDKNRQSA